MIWRDSYGFIIQHDLSDPHYEDGGDTCNRTGLMSFSGSEQDRFNMDRCLIKTPNGYRLVRHPLQLKWDEPEQLSRDALVTYFAGFTGSDKQKAAAAYYASIWFLNKDFLDPSVRLNLYRIAGIKAPLHIRIMAPIVFRASMFWNTKVKPGEEMLQFISLCIGYGKEAVAELCAKHPNLEQSIKDYFSGWRDQPEIARDLILALKRFMLPEEIKR